MKLLVKSKNTSNAPSAMMLIIINMIWILIHQSKKFIVNLNALIQYLLLVHINSNAQNVIMNSHKKMS